MSRMVANMQSQTKFLDRSIGQEIGRSDQKVGCYSNIDAVMVMTDGISDLSLKPRVGLTNHEKWKRLIWPISPVIPTLKMRQVIF